VDTADTGAPDEDCGILPGMRLWVYHGISLDRCYIPVGAILSVPYNQEFPVDPTVSLPATPTAPVEPTPVEPTPVEAAAPAAPVAVTEHVAVPDAPPVPSADELAKVAQAGGSNGLLLALLAVVGSAGAFKFYTDWRKQSHELALKKLDVEADVAAAKANANDYSAAQPPPCAAEKVAVEKRLASLTEAVEALSTRVAKAEKATASFGTVDLDDHEDRLSKLEKTLKAKAKTATRSTGTK